MSLQKIILIAGPTASGKTRLSLEIARQNNGLIINADSMQVYEGLPILTNQPSASDYAQIPHQGFGICDGAVRFSVGKWLTYTNRAIDAAIAQHHTPILVGGTGLYFRALTHGLSTIPDIPADAMTETESLYAQMGEVEFRKKLSRLDSISAEKIAKNDRQRLIRAYNVVIHTGKPIHEWQNASQAPAPKFAFESHLMMPERKDLYEACDKRFLMMIEQGAITEVENLLSRNLPQDLPIMKILGVREIAGYLKKETTLPQAIATAQQATRNYAKRQMTWFRNSWVA